jgi:hypothetical protein
MVGDHQSKVDSRRAQSTRVDPLVRSAPVGRFEPGFHRPTRLCFFASAAWMLSFGGDSGDPILQKEPAFFLRMLEIAAGIIALWYMTTVRQSSTRVG